MTLSRDHHHALVIAMTLARAGERTARSSATLYADFIVEHEAQHFAIEEELLLPALPATERGAALAERIRAEHRELCAAARQLRAPALEPPLERLHELAGRLRDHVKLEERELFPYLEETLAPEQLELIGAQIAAERS